VQDNAERDITRYEDSKRSGSLFQQFLQFTTDFLTTQVYLFLGERNHQHSHIAKIRTSLYSYWDVFSERFVDHFHMTLVYNFLTHFSTHFWRKLDEQYAPNSASLKSANTREWMEEPQEMKSERRALIS